MSVQVHWPGDQRRRWLINPPCFSVMSRAKPPDIKGCGVIVMVGLDFEFSADFTGAFDQGAIPDCVTDRNVGGTLLRVLFYPALIVLRPLVFILRAVDLGAYLTRLSSAPLTIVSPDSFDVGFPVCADLSLPALSAVAITNVEFSDVLALTTLSACFHSYIFPMLGIYERDLVVQILIESRLS